MTIKRFILEWRAKRELRKGAKVLERIANEAPASLLKHLLFDAQTGMPLDHVDTRNALMNIAAEMRGKS
jgi:hypothetical protein